MTPLEPGLAACAPWVAPHTLAEVIRVESGGHPWAIQINGIRRSPRPASRAQAAKWARVAIASGRTVDLGYMQVNSRNLRSLGLSVEQALEPCANIRAGATILAADYTAAVQRQGPGRGALLAALSAYNTGDFERGFANGYVARYAGRSGAADVRRDDGPASRYAASATLRIQWSPP